MSRWLWASLALTILVSTFIGYASIELFGVWGLLTLPINMYLGQAGACWAMVREGRVLPRAQVRRGA